MQPLTPIDMNTSFQLIRDHILSAVREHEKAVEEHQEKRDGLLRELAELDKTVVVKAPAGPLTVNGHAPTIGENGEPLSLAKAIEHVLEAHPGQWFNAKALEAAIQQLPVQTKGKPDRPSIRSVLHRRAQALGLEKRKLATKGVCWQRPPAAGGTQ